MSGGCTTENGCHVFSRGGSRCHDSSSTGGCRRITHLLLWLWLWLLSMWLLWMIRIVSIMATITVRRRSRNGRSMIGPPPIMIRWIWLRGWRTISLPRGLWNDSCSWSRSGRHGRATTNTTTTSRTRIEHGECCRSRIVAVVRLIVVGRWHAIPHRWGHVSRSWSSGGTLNGVIGGIPIATSHACNAW
jgi:hypothetical protein